MTKTDDGRAGELSGRLEALADDKTLNRYYTTRDPADLREAASLIDSQASEIRELREALERVRDEVVPGIGGGDEIDKIARAALKGKP